jgi:hypothetical protein
MLVIINTLTNTVNIVRRVQSFLKYYSNISTYVRACKCVSLVSQHTIGYTWRLESSLHTSQYTLRSWSNPITINSSLQLSCKPPQLQRFSFKSNQWNATKQYTVLHKLRITVYNISHIRKRRYCAPSFPSERGEYISMQLVSTLCMQLLAH